MTDHWGVSTGSQLPSRMRISPEDWQIITSRVWALIINFVSTLRETSFSGRLQLQLRQPLLYPLVGLGPMHLAWVQMHSFRQYLSRVHWRWGKSLGPKLELYVHKIISFTTEDCTSYTIPLLREIGQVTQYSYTIILLSFCFSHTHTHRHRHTCKHASYACMCMHTHMHACTWVCLGLKILHWKYLKRP